MTEEIFTNLVGLMKEYPWAGWVATGIYALTKGVAWAIKGYDYFSGNSAVTAQQKQLFDFLASRLESEHGWTLTNDNSITYKGNATTGQPSVYISPIGVPMISVGGESVVDSLTPRLKRKVVKGGRRIHARLKAHSDTARLNMILGGSKTA